MEKYHVGVDAGKDGHHICIRDLSRDTYYKTFKVKNDHDGFMEFVSSLEKLSVDKNDFLIGVEACFYGLNLSYFLMGMGFDLVEVNPFRAGLADERAMMIIHLKEALSVLFPEFGKVFRQLDSKASLALLMAFPSPGHLIDAGEERVAESLSLANPHRMSKGMAKRIMEAAKVSVGVVQKQPGLGIKISILAQGIAGLQSAIP